MKKINIALIGTGFMGRTHAYSVKNLPFFYGGLPFVPVLRTVCARDPQKTADFAAAYGFEKHTCDPDEIFCDPSVDAVDICTPNDSHAALIKKALAAGKHVLCEKPVVSSPADSEELKKLLARSPETVHQTVFNNRFIPAVMRAERLVREGKLGRILTFRAAYLHTSALDPEKPAGWKQTAKNGGGVLFDLGTHAVDLFLYVTQSDPSCRPESVCGRQQIGFPVRRGVDGKEWKTDADEAFYMLCKLKNGAVGTFEASKLAQGTNDGLTLDIRGEKGALHFDLMQPNYLYFYDAARSGSPIGGERGYTAIECVGRRPEPAAALFPSVKAPVGWLSGHVGSMYAFLDCVAAGRQASPSLLDGLYVNDVLYAARRSDAGGKWETINGEDDLK